MTSALRSAAVRRVLDELRRLSEAEDAPAIARMRAHEERLGRRVYGSERGAVYGPAPTTEIDPDKASRARRNLARAGLDDVVELREGDALVTLRDIRRVDLLFLDGWNNLYLPVLDLLEPSLSPRALVVADLSAGDPEQAAYCERMHDPEGGYVTVDVPLDAGVLVSARALSGGL